MTTITFVRHGNTDFNNERRAQGHMNNPLNETGRMQALAVASRLAEEPWDLFISSDLLRARETAEAISAAVNMTPSFDVRLREIGRGQIEGTVEAERVEKWGKDWRKLDLGEESKQSVRARGMSFVEEVASQYRGKKLLVVSHGLLIGQTLKGLLQDEKTGDGLPNTSVTTIRLADECWEYALYSCIRHLEGS
ncbi:Phosphoserine phosphatase 1 [Paenibacillus solanacearum]|uniref:Phosphoserine phosphatase 1 n=1 Tax=Paenibacillus solanacearum TaxID=2048548 RepID=A0A916JT50_9BACL|nr:histidine phosphatase family protein [Paenibacillus solanacearum]CAG7601235.1 Phosphoserine phosphatase 1 [Paenibacillus solanacearum]